MSAASGASTASARRPASTRPSTRCSPTAVDAARFAPWWTAHGNDNWLRQREKLLALLDEQAHLERMARIVGKDALPAGAAADAAGRRPGQRGPAAPVGVLAGRPLLLGRAAERDAAPGDALHRPGARGASRAARSPSSSPRCRCMRRLQRMGEEIGEDELGALRRAVAAARTRTGGAAGGARRRGSEGLTMWAELSVQGTALRIDGPLLFLRRNLEVDAGRGGRGAGRRRRPRARVGRVTSLDDDDHRDRGARQHAGPEPGRACGCAFAASRCASASARACSVASSTAWASRPTAGRRWRRSNGGASTRAPMNPAQRALPRDFIETGVSAIDLTNSLIRGQKLPIFSAGGLPHDRLAIEIARHARLRAGDTGPPRAATSRSSSSASACPTTRPRTSAARWRIPAPSATPRCS